MSFKKSIFFISIVIIVFITGILFVNNFFSNEKKSLTLKEAYNLAISQISEEDVYLYTMTSADIENMVDEEDGLNGQRRFWNLDFNKLNSTEHYIFQIQDGKIMNFVQVPGIDVGAEKLITLNELTVDSNNALEIALNIYELQAGTIWAIGHHFMLNKYDGNATLSVTGFDSEGNFKKVHINLLDLTYVLE